MWTETDVEKILETMQQAHEDLQMALTRMYPGNLVLCLDSGILNHRLL